MDTEENTWVVIPAKAGIQWLFTENNERHWIPDRSIRE